MLRLSATVAVFFTLATSSPITDGKRSTVISLPPRSLPRHSSGAFNADIALKDQARVRHKYASSRKRRTAGAHLNRRGSGSEPLKDDYSEGLDLRELRLPVLILV